jgi:hypothetical protein
MTFEEIARYFGLGASFVPAAIIYTLFRFLDKRASPAANGAVNAWMKGEHYKLLSLRDAVVEGFDHLYGTPLLSTRTFFRSAGISLLAVGAYMLWLFRHSVHSHEWTWWAVPGYILVAVIISDFISLFWVRRCLTLGRINLRLSVLLALIGAVIATLVIVSITAFLDGSASFLVGYLVGFGQVVLKEQLFEKGEYFAIAAMTMGALKEGLISSIRLGWLTLHLITDINLWHDVPSFIAPGLLVHLWLPLLLVSGTITRSLPVFFRTVSLTQWFIKHGDNHPFDAIGIVASTLVFVGAALWQSIHYFVHL